MLGALFLLQTLGVVETGLSLLWVGLFAASGVTFLYFYNLNREQWWAAILGFAMLGISALITVAEYGPSGWKDMAGGIFMLSIGLSFLFVYVRNREMWWPIIPMGLCITIGIMSILEALLGEGEVTGAVFFLGGALTFGLLGFVPASKGRTSWAFIPAVVMLIVGVVILAAVYEASQIIGAVALVLVGLILILRTFTRREQTSSE
jgi:hypothetical protein